MVTLSGQSLSFRVKNTGTKKEEAIIMDPNGFYQDATGKTNSSNITVEGLDISITSFMRYLLQKGYAFKGIRLKVPAGDEAQFDNSIRVFEAKQFSKSVNEVTTIKPNTFIAATDYKGNQSDIVQKFYMNAFRSLVTDMEAGATATYQLFIEKIDHNQLVSTSV